MTDTSETPVAGKHSLLKFLIPSLIGLMLFLVPYPTDDGVTILFGIYSSWVNEHFGFILVELVVIITNFAALAGLYYLIFKPDWATSRPTLHAMFETTLGWFVLRAIGAIISIMVYYEIGPEILRLEDTDVVLVTDLAIAFSIVLIPACFFMPLLTEYGAMEFFGTFVAPAFRKWFRLPGRSAVDATASFISASGVGILVTGQQYRRGFYNGREAVAVATNFSVVSLPFALVIAEVSKIDHMFSPGI